MYAAGTGTKVAASLFFMLIMIGCFCNSIIHFVTAIICASASHARQQQQVNTEYEQNCFHAAKIMDYKKLFRSNQKYYHNKVAMIITIKELAILKFYAIAGS